ncbi:DUF4232 domain-containing protein [Streptomyces sp. NBC_01433]|uniref:DUF4232 domain-containing protein n=1 Tax=Streptomyces sp. NBC_01433 TaxID=2903864 RepID=UPI00225666CC|nr:DUF4232 domain-containing protein [Streptomyces sp. NBC_01433]MCX4681165.1 DUF4232 domain-containing protein [Streptomyces sp. NBC_01433]
MMRTNRKIAVTLAATVLAGAAAGGVAQASSATGRSVAPSACRPANHTAKITDAPSSAGHRHYRVTLTAPRGYEPCELAGSPTDVRFSDHGSDSGVTAGRYGSQETAVTFGPGHPVHFDIQVPNTGRVTPADEASFTLQAPGGQIPGTSFAEGGFTVATGTLIGPVQRGV